MSRAVTVEVLTAHQAEPAQRRAAGALLASGLHAGDRVAFCLPSSAALLCAVLGALRVGVVPVLLNATLLDDERDALVADARPALVVTDREALDALDGGPAADLAPFPLARPMHYTSGTTGRCKGVWSGVWSATEAAAAFADEADLWSFGPDDVHLVCSPMYHSVSVRFAGGTLLRGGTCVVLSRFDADVARDLLAGGTGPTPTTTFMAPAALARLLATVEGTEERFDDPAPAGPRRLALPAVPQAGGPGAGGPRGAVGVLRLHRGPVHRVLARGVVGAPGHRRTGPARAGPLRGRGRHHLVPSAGLRPLPLLG